MRFLRGLMAIGLLNLIIQRPIFPKPGLSGNHQPKGPDDTKFERDQICYVFSSPSRVARNAEISGGKS